MRKLTALILCVLYMVLLFSGCKKIAENPPAASTEPSTAPTESTSETIKPYTGPIITTRPTEPPTTTEPSVDLYPQYVQTGINEIVMCRVSDTSPRKPVPFRIPELLPFSEDAIACQKEIQNYFGPLLEQVRQEASEGNYSIYASIDHSVYLNNTILSVVIRENTLGDAVNFHIYNFDVESGKRLDTDALIEKLQMTDYTEKLTQAVKEFHDNYTAMVVDRVENNKRLELTIAPENLAKAMPYVAEDGQLMAVVTIYITAGMGHYDHEIPIT